MKLRDLLKVCEEYVYICDKNGKEVDGDPNDFLDRRSFDKYTVKCVSNGCWRGMDCFDIEIKEEFKE